MIGPAGERVAMNLRRLRITRRLSLAELAAEVQKRGHTLSAAAIGKIENGRPTAPSPKATRRADIDDVLALAACLKVRPEDLWADPGECEVCSKGAPRGFECAVCPTRGAGRTV